MKTSRLLKLICIILMCTLFNPNHFFLFKEAEGGIEGVERIYTNQVQRDQVEWALNGFEYAYNKYPELKSVILFFSVYMIAPFYMPYAIHIPLYIDEKLLWAARLVINSNVLLATNKDLLIETDEELVMFLVFHEVGHAVSDLHGIKMSSNNYDFNLEEDKANEFAYSLFKEWKNKTSTN